MPRIIDYDVVFARMQGDGLRCVYHNSGAFAFEGGEVKTIGWVGPDDPTIRESARAFVKRVPPPYEANLAEMLVKAVPGVAWVMPMSHWAYELEFGSSDWLAEALREILIDAELLRPRANAAAIEFAGDETQLLKTFSMRLLENLRASDFMIAFPGHATICTLHHHKQLWWQTTDARVASLLTQLTIEN